MHGSDDPPTTVEPPTVARPTTSTRDPGELGRRLGRWLAATLPPGSAPEVSAVELASGNGMSSETVLFDATWQESGARRTRPLVARVAPEPSTLPVFPVYDMQRQFRVMRTIRACSRIPVPAVLWSETDEQALGAPFFVMERVTGLVPPDVMPYNFGSWLTDASPAERARLQESSVQVLADLHGISRPVERFGFLRAEQPTGATALDAHVTGQRAYYDWVSSDGIRSPLIEAGFSWLDAHRPRQPGPTVLSWGDARIGNIMYRDFQPVAVLDWEMAGLAPPEVDLGWLIYLHRFFEDLATAAGLPGMPDFLRRDDVADRYWRMTGYRPADLDFYTLYAALRQAIVMFRVQRRRIHFGEAEPPANPDDMIMHRRALEAMLAGTYWEEVG
ncbi:phosphotransferase family protein [Amycolatopsis anabasis]|uniref:phosphotransferase family protein n=1 Tax=Amycolatopsis anabasis TaxID=1840409 RepID=UPI00131CBC0D|nr:phosphotransferase family protein [Amycolatopsis anabasis]